LLLNEERAGKTSALSWATPQLVRQASAAGKNAEQIGVGGRLIAFVFDDVGKAMQGIPGPAVEHPLVMAFADENSHGWLVGVVVGHKVSSRRMGWLDSCGKFYHRLAYAAIVTPMGL
jgi:hypothetical protein